MASGALLEPGTATSHPVDILSSYLQLPKATMGTPTTHTLGCSLLLGIAEGVGGAPGSYGDTQVFYSEGPVHSDKGSLHTHGL